MIRSTWTAGIVAALALGTAALEAAPILGPEIEQAPRAVDRGELLMGELNCAACHATDGPTTQRLNSRTAPLLQNVGSRVTPQELRHWISNPQEAKPGSTMPDVLGQLPPGERAETTEDLTHFLASLGAGPKPGHVYDELKARQGRALYHKVGCVACHAPQAPSSEFNRGAAEADDSQIWSRGIWETNSAPLGNLARKYTVQALSGFLLDPLKARPSGRMPSLNLSQGEAVSIAMFLLREQSRNPAGGGPQRLAGLAYAYSEEGIGEDPDFGKLPILHTGSVEGPSLAVRKRDQNFAIRFTGYIKISTPGKYTFFSASDDGSRVLIGDKVVVDNWGMHAAEEKRGEIELAAGDHPFTVLYYQGGGEYALRVSYSGPGIRKQVIPTSAFSHEGRPMIPMGSAEFALQPERVERGRRQFAALGCASCHDTGSGIQAPSGLKPLTELANLQAGCLAEQPQGKSANYNLSAPQREQIRQTLAQREKLKEPLSAPEQITRTLNTLNCLACHTRDGEGGATSARLEYFTTLGEAELGDEGRVPPHLTNVGAKLKPEWLREVLLNGASARPYMATRMPQFGERAAGRLAALLEQADARPQARPAPSVPDRDAKLGRRLVGVGGLSCIACHTFGPHKSLGIPAMDLTQVTKRVKYDWFHNYLVDPQSLRPNTRMPSFWPNGEAVNKELLGGNTEKQVAAIWAYLAQGTQADPPDGLIQGKKEIVAEGHPVFYRHFIQGAGTRAIGVGYPEKVNLAFDANDNRLALIWQGAFIDAAKHSTGRGEGFEPPLGHNVVRLPNGPSVASLESLQALWPENARTNDAYHFRGYTLDEHLRPTFRHGYGEALVEEYFEPIPGEIDSGFIRKVAVTGVKKPGLHFRLGAGNEVRSLGENTFVVDRKLQIRVIGAEARTRVVNGRTEIVVPLATDSKFSAQLIW